MERVLDDARHELRRDEVRELRREGRQQFGAVRLLVRLDRRQHILQRGAEPPAQPAKPPGKPG